MRVIILKTKRGKISQVTHVHVFKLLQIRECPIGDYPKFVAVQKTERNAKWQRVGSGKI